MQYANPLGGGLSDLALLTNAKSRSLSPENKDGAPGGGAHCPLEQGSAREAARELGTGWKVNPFVVIKAGTTYEIGNIEGPGTIDHIWMTPTGAWRDSILRFYWDDQEQPSVECPVGDFFACGWGQYAPVTSLAVCVNPGSAFNCYWKMPFKKRCRITLENRSVDDMVLYYQVDYTLTELPENVAYFHAQFRRVNPLPYKDVYTLVDGIEGRGQYVGVYMCWGVNSCNWWGEGEIKFYIDADTDAPTICGTGTEDYFCGSYNFENQKTHRYEAFSTPYSGMPQVIEPDGLYRSQQRFGLYRWHITDPVRFEKCLRVTIQALGWRSHGRYLPLQDDIASVVFWYQDLPSIPFPALPDRNALEVI